MKNILKLLGIIALVAIIGFSMAGCGGGGGGSGGDDSSNNNNDSTNDNGAAPTTGSIKMENNTGKTILQIRLSDYDSATELNRFDVNVTNGNSYTITGLSPGSYALALYNDLSGIPVPLIVSHRLTVKAGQTVTFQATSW
jgi:hypothetical protein